MTSPAPPDLDVSLEAGDWGDMDALEIMIGRTIATTCETAALAMQPQSEAGILLTDDAHIRDLNRVHRDRDAATNVLAFPICAPEMPVKGPLLGDVVLAYETVVREAQDGGLALEHHICHLIVHGFLHLFGYDHQIGDEAEVMEALETEVMKRLGLPDPHRLAAD